MNTDIKSLTIWRLRSAVIFKLVAVRLLIIMRPVTFLSISVKPKPLLSLFCDA